MSEQRVTVEECISWMRQMTEWVLDECGPSEASEKKIRAEAERMMAFVQSLHDRLLDFG